jgi:CBS domain-containing protein
MHPAITCSKGTTLERVIRKLDTSRIHRIYIKDDDNRPVRVVSLRDVLAVVVGDEL